MKYVKKKSAKKIASILISSNQLIKNIEPLIIKKIKENLGFKIIFIAKTKEDVLFYKKNYGDCFDEIYNDKFKIDNSYIQNHNKYKNPEKKALLLEKKYNLSIFRLFFTHRVFGRGFFASGGVRHPRNKTHELSSYKDLLSMAINYINSWEDLFNKENVSFCLNLDPISHQLALKNNIKAFRLVEGRFKNTICWVDHAKLDPKVNLKDLKAYKKNSLKRVIINKPYESYAHARAVDVYKLKLTSTIKEIFITTLRNIYGKLRAYEKSRNKFILDEIFYIWGRRKSYIEYSKKAHTNLTKLKGKKLSRVSSLSK